MKIDQDTITSLRNLLEEATALDLSTAEHKRKDRWIECPVCGGEGSVEGTDYCNIDNEPIGIFVYGIGDKMVAAEKLVSMMTSALPGLLDIAEKSGWKPIDTAPISNGCNPFLAYIMGHGSHVCYRTKDDIILSSSDGKQIHRATHWSPLPKPPHETNHD